MKKGSDVLQELKNAYKESLPTISSEAVFSDECFCVYLTDHLMVSVSFEDDYALTTLNRESDFSGKIDNAKKFKEKMEKILGFAPYCLYYSSASGVITMVWIEKNHEKHYAFFEKHQDSIYHDLIKI